MISTAPARGPSERPASTRGDGGDDDNSSPSHPRFATPPRHGGSSNVHDNDDGDSVARAAAEVSVLPAAGPDTGVGGEARGDARRSLPPGAAAAHAAIQGTVGGEEGEAPAFEVVDEGGELVRGRFHEFLNN